MADSRNLTIGMQFALREAVSQVEDLLESLEDIKQGMIWAEQESDEMGSRAGRGAREIEDGLKSAGAQVQETGTKIAET